MIVTNENIVKYGLYPESKMWTALLAGELNTGSKEISIQITHVNPNGFQPLHSHPEDQCYYIISGCGLMTINNEEKFVNSGDLIFIPGNSQHGIKNINNSNLTYLTANRSFGINNEKNIWFNERVDDLSRINFRVVNANDLSAICILPQNEEELFFMFPKARYPLDNEQLQTAIDQRNDSMVIDLNGEIIAFSNFYKWGNECCSIGNVIIKNEYRGRGIGKILISKMIEIAINKYKTEKVCISYFEANKIAPKLYASLGFIDCGFELRKDKYDKEVKLINMEKKIMKAV